MTRDEVLGRLYRMQVAAMTSFEDRDHDEDVIASAARCVEVINSFLDKDMMQLHDLAAIETYQELVEYRQQFIDHHT